MIIIVIMDVEHHYHHYHHHHDHEFTCFRSWVKVIHICQEFFFLSPSPSHRLQTEPPSPGIDFDEFYYDFDYLVKFFMIGVRTLLKIAVVIMMMMIAILMMVTILLWLFYDFWSFFSFSYKKSGFYHLWARDRRACPGTSFWPSWTGGDVCMKVKVLSFISFCLLSFIVSAWHGLIDESTRK